MAEQKQFLDPVGLAHLWAKIKALLPGKGVTTEGSGTAYTATVPGIKALEAGVSFTMLPHVVSASAAPTLDVNGLGAKAIRRRVTNATNATATGYAAAWLAANKPIRVEFDGTFWLADLPKPSAADISGTMKIANGGTGADTAEEALVNLGLTATAAELNFMAGVTSGVQAQLNGQYIATITTGSADDINVALTLRDIRTDNDELYNMFATGGTKSENYAYIITLFLNSTNADASKVQIAVGYTNGHIATRAFYSVTGWKPWNMMMSGILHPYFTGSSLPAAGTTNRIFFLTE